MDTPDAAAEYLRISEHYRQMKDEELLALAPQTDSLTPFAQQALATEIRQRGLKVETVEEKPAAPARFQAAFNAPSPKFRDRADRDSSSVDVGNGVELEEEDPYEEDRKLFTLCTVWSLRDALKVQRILDVAGIPFSMGKEMATGVDKVTSKFADGVGVQIMQIGLPWAYQAMKGSYFPEDNPEEPFDETKQLVVRCPRCWSTEVVFDGRGGAAAGDDASRKFRWTCDACNYRWEDDGVGREK